MRKTSNKTPFLQLITRERTTKVENALQIYMRSREQIIEATRKVKSNGYNVVGIAPSRKVSKMIQTESILEDDFLTLLEFDQGVSMYFDQPFKIKFKDPQTGKLRRYTPDFLVKFRSDWKPYKGKKPILYEVKPSKFVEEKKDYNRPRFAAGKAFGKAKGYDFKVITEKQIRGHYLENAKRLLPYLKFNLNSGLTIQVMDSIQALKVATPSEVLALATQDPERKMHLVNALLQLIGNRMIGCDLHQPLTMESKIWFKKRKMFDPKSPIL